MVDVLHPHELTVRVSASCVEPPSKRKESNSNGAILKHVSSGCPNDGLLFSIVVGVVFVVVIVSHFPSSDVTSRLAYSFYNRQTFFSYTATPLLWAAPKLIHDPDPPFLTVNVIDRLNFLYKHNDREGIEQPTQIHAHICDPIRSMAWISSGLCVHKIFHRHERNALGKYHPRSERGFPSLRMTVWGIWGSADSVTHLAKRI